MSQRKIKVIQLLEWFERGGGLEQVVGEIASGLDKNRYDVEIWCIDRGGSLVYEYRNQGIPVRVLHIYNYHNPFSLYKLVKLFKEHKPDIIHSHIYFAGTAGRIAGMIARVPVMIHHVHSTYWQFSLLNRLIENYLSHQTDKILCVSEAVKKFVIEDEYINPQKVEVIYNGISKKNVDSNKIQFRRLLGIDDNDILLVSVASLLENKGHNVLLEAIALLKNKLPNIKCLIVGDGSEKARLIEKTSALGLTSNIKFLGVRSDVPSILNSSDIFVLASLEREGLPISIMEAMAYGVPVVASRVGGVPELINDKVNGYLFSSRNIQELADCIFELGVNQEKRKVLAVSAQESFQNYFDSQSMINRIDQIYRQTLTHHQKI